MSNATVSNATVSNSRLSSHVWAGLLVHVLIVVLVPARFSAAQDPGSMRVALEALVANSEAVALVKGKATRLGEGEKSEAEVVFEVLAYLKKDFDPYRPEPLKPLPDDGAESDTVARAELVLPAKSLRVDGQYYWSDRLKDPASGLPPESFTDGEPSFLVFQNYGALDPPIHIIVDFEQGLVTANWQWLTGKDRILRATRACIQTYRGTESLRTIRLTTGYFDSAISRLNDEAPNDDDVLGRWLIFPCDNHYADLLVACATDPTAMENPRNGEADSHWLHCVHSLQYFPSTEAEARIRAVLEDAAIGDAPKQALRELLSTWEGQATTSGGEDR